MLEPFYFYIYINIFPYILNIILIKVHSQSYHTHINTYYSVLICVDRVIRWLYNLNIKDILSFYQKNKL